jgi:hypothetical protein
LFFFQPNNLSVICNPWMPSRPLAPRANSTAQIFPENRLPQLASAIHENVEFFLLIQADMGTGDGQDGTERTGEFEFGFPVSYFATPAGWVSRFGGVPEK